MIPKIRLGINNRQRRIRKSVHVLLAIMLMIPLLFSGGGAANAANGWSMIDGGGPNGLNVNAANRAESPAMVVWNGEVYVTWQEKVVPGVTAAQIRVKKYNGTGWTSVDGNGPNGLNMNSGKEGTMPTLAVFNGSLYLAWVEAVTSSYGQIRVKKYNGTGWTSAEGESTTGINVDAAKGANFPTLVEYNNALYASWSELGKIYVKRYNGTEWMSVDGGTNGLNIDPAKAAAFPALAVLGNELIAVWSELSGSIYQLRAKKYDGTSWTTIDGGATGLNIATGKSAYYPTLAAVDGVLYAAWHEPADSTTDDQIRVKKYDGNAWSSVDGGGKYGINVSTAFRANYVKLAVANHDLYAVWSEHSGMAGSTPVFKIRAKMYNGTVWTSAEYGLNGFIVDNTKAAFNPAITVLNNGLFVAWEEQNSSGMEQLRVANLPAPAVNSVAVTPGTAIIAQGGSKNLTAAVDAVGGAATTVTWTSSDAKVVVDSAGEVTVAADATPGDYMITATSTVNNSKTGTATITVIPPTINSVLVSPIRATVVQGGSRQFAAVVDAVGGSATTVTWTSSDVADKVTVSSTGNVTVAADAVPGVYTITATSTVDISKKGTAPVTVTATPAINSVTVSPITANVVQGGSKNLTATVDAVGGAATTVTWTSSDAKVVVDSAGKVTVATDAALGDYTITATSTANNSKKGTATITVTTAPAINSVSVSPSTASVVQGGTEQLTATVDAVGGAATTVTWTSSDAKVVVDSAGKVTVATGAPPGNYTITATSTFNNSKKGTATITVTAIPPAVNSVTVTPSTASVVQGGSKQLTATVDAVGGAATTVTWTSSDAKVVVDSAGEVTVAADATPGDYTIMATSTVNSSKKGTATITVTAAPAINSVTVSPSTASVVQGGSKQLTATVDAVGGAATTVTWTSSDAKVVVDSAGEVTVAADATPGDYTITATSTVNSSKKGTATITVTAAPAINSVTVSPSTGSVVQGGSKQLTASVDVVGGAATTVTWTSSDAKVAVDSAGKVTVAADATPGDYTITATSTVNIGKKVTATITVTAAPAITSVTVTPSTASVVQGGSKQLTATVDAVGGAAMTVTWTSNDAKVAVDSAGEVTVAADATPGDYTITATSTVNSSKKGTATVTVTAAPAITSVTVTPITASVVQRGSKQLTATVDAVGGSATTVTWTSSDAKVAVDNTGKVTVATDATPGNYTITATSTVNIGKKGTATITVTAALTYTIAAITDQTLTALTQGYVSGTQETRPVIIVNTGTGDLLNLTVTLSDTSANDYVITQPDSTLTSGESTSFDIHTKDGLLANTYTATVTISADHLTPVTFDATQAVNLPNAPANPQNLAADVGDRQITLSWNTVSDATKYHIYMATDADLTNIVEEATVTSSTYSIQDLVNGTAYYFVVKSENLGGLSAASNQISATPATIPGAPSDVTAVAGNGQAVVTFTAPSDNGGSTITEYEVTASPGNIVIIGGASPITFTGLTNETSYTFTVKAINGAGKSAASAESNTAIPRASTTPSEPSEPSQPSAPTTPVNTSTGVDILVNGKVENAGTAAIGTRDNQTEMTVVVDQKKLDAKLAAEGQHAVVTIPISRKFDIVVGELNGQMVKNMEDKQAVLAFKTDYATYTLPARQINIGAISEQVGALIALQDIKVRIEIAVPTTDTLKVVESTAAYGQLALVSQPLNFTVRAVYDDKIVEVTKFDAYVERTIAIPDEVDPNKITTGVVVEEDGSVRHVPTKVRHINGMYEAQINSLTNSTYAVVWHPLEFSDMANHWAKNAVNDMGSRMVVDGTGSGMFSPDREITRAEFTAIIVRGLGLKLENGATPFSDVKLADWYSSAVKTAYSYQLISGLDDVTFRPNDTITREQAMVILSNAMVITGLKDKVFEQSAAAELLPFEDTSEVSSWAQSSVADNVMAGIIFGRNGAILAPKGYITRAEVATMVQRLLQKSGLI
ncbi:Ig-like domain-containing protein [Paenibacillus sp. 2RAB27]|uniref:Ig-like domain-containing protein n=1 Tax=Paenibacillus sp. 2RAB27 TaxID=3232991 RepID=UPI003F9E6BA0